MKPLQLVALALAAGITAASAQEPSPTPRFRGGANLVRVDAYVTADGQPLADLRADDFEVVEDGVPQQIESFEFIRPRPPAPQSARVEPNTVAASRAMATDADSRVFVLFMDVRHVSLSGSFRAQVPVTRLLDRVIGQDDLVGVMTPDMSARNLTLARRTATIEGLLQDHWYWGERGRLGTTDPREEEIRLCYPDADESAGIAEEIIRRRRLKATLDALEDLIQHLEDVREERKFVLLLTEGWVLFRNSDQLARPIRRGAERDAWAPGRPEPVGVDPQGGLRVGGRFEDRYESCERERSLLAFLNAQVEFNQLLQRANRANVSFYPIDARGLVVFDQPVGGPERQVPPDVDARNLLERRATMQDLASATDGIAIVADNDLDRPLARILADTASYYLLGYYSSNTRLDGRFRRISVRVKRPGAEVRARPGYLAPTEAEMASARVDALMNGAPPGHSTLPRSLAVALDSLAPARGTLPLRAQAAGGAGAIWVTAELDAATLRQAEWQGGVRARVSYEHERGAVPASVANVTLDPGQRTLSIMHPEGTVLPPGRYVIRLQLAPAASRTPLQTTLDVIVPGEGALLGSGALASRRGPTTGLNYVPTADARFRRTERIRLQIPKLGAGTLTARLLNREAQPLPLPVTLAERLDQTLQVKFVVADLTLAPLAQGEYVIEVAAEHNGRQESVAYGFRIVP
ncbi:MAG: VWA domain-containing protein [Acidobacteriota bacterium]